MSIVSSCTEMSLSLVVSSLINMPFSRLRILVLHQRRPLWLCLLLVHLESLDVRDYCEDKDIEVNLYNWAYMLTSLRALGLKLSLDLGDVPLGLQHTLWASGFLVMLPFFGWEVEVFSDAPPGAAGLSLGLRLIGDAPPFLVATLSSDAHRLDLSNNIFIHNLPI